MAFTSDLRQQPAEPQNPSIVRSGNTITLAWDAVTEDVDSSPMTGISYKVYIGDLPDFVCNDDDNLIETVTVPTLVLNNANSTMDRAFFKVIAVGAGDVPPVPGNFVLVPGGTFIMGRAVGEGNDNELPTHSVTLDSFYMSKHQVTQAEYEAIMGSNPATASFGMGDNYPVYFLNWYSAIIYCNMRSIAEELTPVYSISGSTNPEFWGALPTSSNDDWNAANCDWNANGYRLPTEAEWEYAARGATNDTDYLYSGSNDIGEVGWYTGNNSPRGCKPVGTKAPNALDIYDMSGNVYEWCWDWYENYSADVQINPTGAENGPHRVLRGGYWLGSASICRVACRYHSTPNYRYFTFGFRLCRSGL